MLHVALAAFALDLQIDAATVGDALAQIAPKIGARLDADEAIAKEIVAVRFRGVAPEEALHRLAEGLNATWRTDEDGRRLTRTDAQALQEKNAAVAWAERSLAAFARRARRTADAQPPFDADASLRSLAANWDARRRGDDPSGDPMALLPLGRFETEIAAALDPATLARLPYGRRMVFSNAPNRRQLPLNDAMRGALQRLEARRAALLHAAERFELVPPWPKRERATIADLRPTRSDAFRLWVRRDEDGVHYGTLLFGSRWELLLGGGEDQIDYEPPEPDVAAPKGEPKLERGARLQAWDVPGFDGVYPEPLRTELLHPDRNEPLRDVGRHLIRCAAARGENLVAVLADPMVFAIPKASASPGDYLNGLWAYRHAPREREGWLFVRPIDAPRARRERLDRRVWGDWIRTEDRSELGLRDMFRLSPRIPIVEENPLPAALVRHVVGRDAGWNYPMVRIVAGIPIGLRNVGPYPLTRLPGFAREAALKRIEDGELPIPFGPLDERFVRQRSVNQTGVLDVTDLLVDPGPAAMTFETREVRIRRRVAVPDRTPRRQFELRLGFGGRLGIDLYFNGPDDLVPVVPLRE